MTVAENTDKDTISEDGNRYVDLPPRQTLVLLLSIAAVALCGIVYELIIGTISSYLLGNSVYQFSLTIGFFMFAMGIGSYLSQFLIGQLVRNFVYVEIALAVVGGICSLVLFFVFPIAPALYSAVQFGFILAIGTLVGLEIPLLTRILAQASGTRKSIANVMSLDYVGALVGSVAFPLFLLPSLGLMRASFAIGLINIAVALLSAIYLKDYIANANRMIAMVLAVLVGLVGLTLAADRLTSIAQDHLYFDKVIWHKQTPYQSLVVTRDYKRQDLRLFIDGHIQFSEMDEHRYHEALVHPVMSVAGPARRILVLGGGDGMAVRELLKHPQIERIDLVDIDPEMTRIGKEFQPIVRLNHHSLQDERVHIFNEDAFTFITRDGLPYDRIIIDFPDPHNEAISKLYSVEFYAMLKKRLSDSGALVTQSSSPFFARKTYWTIAATLGDRFKETVSYQIAIPAFGLWGFHISGNTLTGVGNVKVPTRFLTNETFQAATVFGKDIQQPKKKLRPNSIFAPNLYDTYLTDLRGDGGLFKGF